MNTATRRWIGAAIFVWCTLARAAAPGAATAAWVENGVLTPQARELLGALRAVERFGLSPADFADFLAPIESPGSSATDSMRREQAMRAAVTRLVEQLHDGRVSPAAAGYALHQHREPLDAEAAMRALATAAKPLELLETFEPSSPQYRALQRALARYRLIRTDLASLPPASTLRAGMTYAGAEKLRWLLAELGDAPTPADMGAAESTYDAALAASIAGFQRRHGLQADGVLGSRTFAALTVPISRRVRQIELTLERWRWLPELHAPAVIVNVPQYMLYALSDAAPPSSAPALRIPVIVGRTARQTPIFDSRIESVVFRPYWDVPASIVRDELLALIAADPDYLARHDMEIVRRGGRDVQVLDADARGLAALRAGRAGVRQRPGPQNALGLIKFILPNPYDVYLHSTPDQALFAQDRRTLSHGCIRVSDAAGLATYLLKDTQGDWTPDAIEAATCGRTTFTVRLARPVPVFIVYGTVVVDLDGSVLFFEDVYGYDQRLEALLGTTR